MRITIKVSLMDNYTNKDSMDVTVEIPPDEEAGLKTFMSLREEVLRLESTVRRHIQTQKASKAGE